MPHRWLGQDDNVACLNCGGVWRDEDDEVMAANGDSPTPCLSTSAAHGYKGERVCWHGADLFSDAPEWDISCEHIRETDDCNCLLCDS